MKLVSREYKVMLDHRLFEDYAAAVSAFWSEVIELTATTTDIVAKGKLEQTKTRSIEFLDTPNLTLRRNGFVLRSRGKNDDVEYTLKCRSEDRYFAVESDVRGADGLISDEKLEEDIAPPFECRFSHSNTVSAPRGSTLRRADQPTTLGQAAALFPALAAIEHDGRTSDPETAIRPVHNLVAFERVAGGGELVLGAQAGEKAASATVALILWSNGKDGRPMVAEFSFRIKDKDEKYTREGAVSARSFFELVQQMDWCRPEAQTKTEFIYRDRRGD